MTANQIYERFDAETERVADAIARTKRPLYREIAAILTAIRNCRKAGNKEWLEKHGQNLKRLLDLLPSGSGIDSGTTLDKDESNERKLIFDCSFHHMNDGGYYDGWTDHRIIVTPSFDGIDLRITGRDRNEIKDYLHETYHYALTQEVEIE